MRSALVDTNIYCDAMRGETGAVEVFRTFDRILFSPIVIGELLSGFQSGKQEKRNRTQLWKFLAQERIRTVSIDENTAEFYSMVHGQLRKAGTPIPTHDIWLAATALQHGCHFATRDKHFLKIQGLLLCP